MKICPFLVAGQSLAEPLQQVGAATRARESAFATPDVDALLHDDSAPAPSQGVADEVRDQTGFSTGDVEATAQGPASGDGGVPPATDSAAPDHEASTHEDLGILRFGTLGRTGSDATPSPARAPQLSSMECLGETCRFFHAGGCRFDMLFEARGSVIVPSGDVLVQELADGESAGSGDGVSPAASARGVLEEVWTLQRESLREVMGGFRRMESDRQALQTGVTSTVESHAMRLGSGVDKVGNQVGGVAEQVDQVAGQVGKVHSQVSDAVTHLVQVAATVGQVGNAVAKVDSRVNELGTRVATIEERVSEVGGHVSEVGTRVGETSAAVSEKVDAVVGRVGGVESQVGRLGSQVEQVGSQVEQVASQVTRVAAAVASVESQMGQFESHLSNSQSSVAIVASEIQDLRAGLATLANQIKTDSRAPASQLVESLGRQVETVTRELRQLEGTLRAGMNESMRAALQEVQSVTQRAVAGHEAGLRTSIESVLATLRTVVQESKEAMRNTVGESHAQLGSLLARSSAETRAQLERGLAKMLEEMNAVRDVRVQVQAALDGLTRETREVGALARRVESSQVLTHELLDEQRQVHAKMDERERREQARQLNNAGVLSYHQGAYDASVERFREATELDPSLAEAFNNLGLSYTEMGRDEEATIAFQRALELDPAAAHVYNNLGYLYYRRGDLNHAVEMYQRAIQRGADSSAAYSNLANAYYRLKKVDQAVASWRRALEIDPANAKAAAALERLGLEARVPERRS